MFWSLNIEIWNLFDIWYLRFGISLFYANYNETGTGLNLSLMFPPVSNHLPLTENEKSFIRIHFGLIIIKLH